VRRLGEEPLRHRRTDHPGQRGPEIEGLLGGDVVQGQVDVDRRVHPGAVHRHVGQVGGHRDADVILGAQLTERLAGERVRGDDRRRILIGDVGQRIAGVPRIVLMITLLMPSLRLP
jgi:hypothetical protein